jgi:hypothetical protein
MTTFASPPLRSLWALLFAALVFARPVLGGGGAPSPAAPRAGDRAGRAPAPRAPPARLAFYDLLTGDDIAAFTPGLSVGFEAVLAPERPYGPEVCGDVPVVEVGAKLELLDGDSTIAHYWYRNPVIPWDAGAQAARHAHFDAWVDPLADRPERPDAWEFRVNLLSRATEAKAYTLRAAIVVTCGERAPVTLAEGALPWDLGGGRLDAFQARLVRRETMMAAYNYLRPARPTPAGLERQLLGLLRRQGYDARRLALLGDWSVRRDANGSSSRRTLRAQVAHRDSRKGGFWVAEVFFEQARGGDGRAWGPLRYRGRTGVADFPILRKNLFR